MPTLTLTLTLTPLTLTPLTLTLLTLTLLTLTLLTLTLTPRTLTPTPLPPLVSQSPTEAPPRFSSSPFRTVGGPAGNETGANGSSAAQTPEVAFLYATFPRPTETFVRRELRALWGLGAEVAPFSIWKGTPAFDGRPVERFRLRELWSLAWWLPYWACRRPAAFSV